MKSLKVLLVLASAIAEQAMGYESAQYVRVSHILVETKGAAETGLALLSNGATFDWLAPRWSLDEGSGAIGGRLGVTKCSEYVPEFAAHVCSAELGKPGVIKTVFGWHIVVVTQRWSEKPETLSEPDRPAPPVFQPSINLSCSFSGREDQPLVVQIDEANRTAKYANRLALPFINPVSLSLLVNNGNFFRVDRTTGTASVEIEAGSGKPITGLVCRAAERRLF